MWTVDAVITDARRYITDADVDPDAPVRVTARSAAEAV
jgi:hypothetical protein